MRGPASRGDVLPTPPLPLKTSTRCLTPASRCDIKGMSGSGPLGAEAHICWLGQPAHESAAPACSDSGPGQCSGSGAMSSGFALRGLLMTSWMDSGSSKDGAMLMRNASRFVDKYDAEEEVLQGSDRK